MDYSRSSQLVGIFQKIDDLRRVRDALDRGGVTVEDLSWLQEAYARSDIKKSEEKEISLPDSIILGRKNFQLLLACRNVVEASISAYEGDESETERSKRKSNLDAANECLKKFVENNPLAALEESFYPQMAYISLVRHFCEKARTSDTPQYWAGMAISSFEATGLGGDFFHALTGMRIAEVWRLHDQNVMDTIQFHAPDSPPAPANG